MGLINNIQNFLSSSAQTVNKLPVVQNIEQGVGQGVQAAENLVPHFQAVAQNTLGGFGQNLLQAANQVGSTIGQQHIFNTQVPFLPKMPNPTLEQVSGGVANVLNGNNNEGSFLNDFLKGQVQNIPQRFAQANQKFTQDQKLIGQKNLTPDQQSRVVGAMTNVVAGGGGASKVEQSVIDNARMALTHNLKAAAGDVTKEFSPEQIDGVVSHLAGKALTGDFYTDNAIKLANFIDASQKGLLNNAPGGIGLATKNIRSQKTIGQMQQEHQIPDLSKYEQAFNAGDKATLDQLAAKYPEDARFQVHNKIDLTTPPLPPRMSQKALQEGITVPRTGRDISVMPQAQKRFSVAQPTTQEQAATDQFSKMLQEPTIGKSPSLIENPPTNLPPEKPPYSVGQASADPKQVAEQARLASFGARQSLEVRGGNLAHEMDSVLKTPKDNLNLRLALENPKKIDTYAAKASNPEAFAALVPKVQQYYDYALNAAKGQKLPLGEVKDYFTHIWDLSTPEAQKTFDDLLAMKANNFRSGFTKDRVVNTINEGLSAGLKLKNVKASNDIIQYTKSMGKQISNSAFNNTINTLRPSGAVPFADNGTVPYNYEGKLFQQSNKPGNQGTFIDPEIQKYMGYYNKSALADNPVIANLDKINTGLKEIKLAGGFFHGLRESVNYAGQQLMSGHVPDLVGGARSFWDGKYARQQMQGFIQNGTLDAASKMGVDISNAGGIGDEKSDLFSLMRSKDLVKRATFERLIPYYILKTIQNLPETARTPAVGKQIMALYNGLTSEVAGTNKTASQIARATFLAPQFNLGKLINVVSALKPENTPQANFARQALIGTAIATAIEYEVANFLANQKIDVNPASILSNGVLHPNISLPYKSPTGKALAADLPASNVADLYKSGIGSLAKAGIDAVTGNKEQAANDLSQAGTDASHAITSRTGAVFSLANQLASGKDYYGNPLDMGNLAESQLPIPAVQVLKSLQNNPKTGQPTQDFRTAALNTAGLRVHNDQNDPQVQAQTKYFGDLNKTASGLSANDKQLFLGEIHPTTKDANGNSIVDKNAYTSADKFNTLLAHPNLYAAEQQFQQSQPNHDPFWDWTPAQQKAYMQAQVISKNDPGGDKATTKALYGIIPQQLFDQRTQYFNDLVANGNIPAQQQNPNTVQMPQEVQDFWTKYQSLPSGTGARSAALRTPLGQQALGLLNQQTQLTNAQRADMGLPLLPTGNSGGYSSKPKKLPVLKFTNIAKGKGAKTIKFGKVGKLGSVKLPKTKSLSFSSPKLKSVVSNKRKVKLT